MDNIDFTDGALHPDGYVLRLNGYGTRSRRKSREDVPSVEGEER